ncbi:MAG TPA: thioredoxin domain-containing protein [Hanamia sp.]|jgi:protein-disulfide isomerase|nr:thioredoxin domain-containing protein [Hanamia sp.]
MLSKNERIVQTKDIIIGNPAAPVTIMEFIDYESRKCAAANEIVNKILVDFEGKVNFNFRHFPLMRIHQKALKAAEAAVAAAQEGKFLEMHEMLFANQKHLGIISLKSYAKEIGITNKSFLNNLVNGKYGLYVQDDLKYGLRLGVKEVPAFFINGEKIEEEVSLELLSNKINEALKQ